MFQDIEPPNRSNKERVGRRAYSNLGGQAIARTREQISGIAKPLEPDETISLDDSGSSPNNRRKNLFRRLISWWRGLNRNLRFGIISAILLLFGAGALGYYYLISPKGEPVLEITRQEKPQPTTVASPLTGVQVEPELAQRPVTAIMIENSLAARPQSGLTEAGVVFEAIAEGGITRFLALYQESQPQYIGPVRSLRPYYIDWAASFDASVAHVGGSPNALKQIRSSGKDLDQFFNAGSYWRVSSRASPHNVYTSFAKLDALNKKKGYKTSKFNPWPRKKDVKLDQPTATTIDIAVSSANFNVRYGYEPKDNTYLRRLGGKGHLSTRKERDAEPRQIHPNVVIVLVMSRSIVDSSGHNDYDTTGKGAAYIFQDGGVVKGAWIKKSRDSNFSFLDSAEKSLPLNAGQAWVTVVDSSSKVSYTAPKPAASEAQ